MALTKVNLTGTYVDGEGRPLCGELLFSPSAPLTDTSDELLVRQFGCTVLLSEEGTFSVELLSTDNGNLLPSGWCWMVKECFPGVPANLWAFFLAYGAGSTQDISTLEPVAIAPLTAYYLPLSGGTMTGAIVLPGNPGAALDAAPKQYVDAETTRAETAEAALAADVAAAQPLLAQTGVKTANYTAAANQIVPVSTTSNSLTVTLPDAPAAGTLVAVKQIATTSPYLTTVQCAGSDVINKSGGSTSLTLTLLNQGVLLQYGSGVWVILSDDLPLAQLDGRYVPQSSLPLAISSGGTGQVTAAGAYDALSPMTTTGDMEYESGTGTAARLAGSTSATRRFLTQTGTGTASAAPAWAQIAGSDVSGIITGTRPEWYGTITGTGGDQTALTAAIAAINAGTAPGPLVLTQRYAIDSTVTLLPGVDVLCTGQGNRQNFPDTFTGGVIVPSSLFPTGSATPLIAIGSTGTPTTNPCGVTLDGLCLNGIVGGTGSTNATNCVGLLVTDTADVHLTNAYLANFDRPGGTGTAISLASSSAGNGVGFELQHSVISASQQGLYAYGAGVTDMRLSDNLWHACTEAITLGYNGTSNAGGGGFQIVNDHFTYTGMPSTGWYLLTGSQAGDFQVTNCYMDQAGSAVPVQLGNDKGVLANCHWLAASTSTAVSLAKVTVSAPAELNFLGNNANLNGSSVTALLQTSAHAGIPAGGLWLNNTCFGTGGSFIAPLIDSASAVIPQITQPNGSTSDYLRGDGTWQNPSVAAGYVSGQYLCTPASYAPGSQTPLAISTTSMAQVSSSVSTGSFTAPSSGSVVVSVSFCGAASAASCFSAFGLAAHGTTTMYGDSFQTEVSSGGQVNAYSFEIPVAGLTSGGSYDFDLMGCATSGDTFTIYAFGQTSSSPTLGSGGRGGPVVMTVRAV